VRNTKVTKRVAVIVLLVLLTAVSTFVWRVPQRLTHGALCTASNYFDSQGGSPAWSPDGTTIAFRKGAHTWEGKGIWLVRADGSGLRRLSHPSSCYGDDNPSWSPDGKRLVVDDGHGISVIDVTDGSRIKLLGRGNYPDWSHDGRWIAFASGGLDKTRLFVVRADGMGARRIDTGDTQVFFPSWSADGSRIVYAGNRSGLYVADLARGGAGSRSAPTARQTIRTGPRMGSWSPTRRHAASSCGRLVAGASASSTRAGATSPRSTERPGLPTAAGSPFLTKTSSSSTPTEQACTGSPITEPRAVGSVCLPDDR
jgi:Tol biopolymer transport system component